MFTDHLYVSFFEKNLKVSSVNINIFLYVIVFRMWTYLPNQLKPVNFPMTIWIFHLFAISYKIKKRNWVINIDKLILENISMDKISYYVWNSIYLYKYIKIYVYTCIYVWYLYMYLYVLCACVYMNKY